MADSKLPPRLQIDDAVIQPPSSVNVDFDRKPILYLASGKPLVRKAGY